MTGSLVGAAIYIALAVAWVVGASLVGVTAGKRGYNPVLWGVVSLFVSPVVGMVLLALITPSRGPRAGS
jgi:urea transporter